ncbi:MAG: hypothetical protein AMK69_27790 [Nitrospira bacterium SG8_3]|nr:MAG: hypothetical protein AMK69_27790 [Nitrospira bacterium SG8_3]
MCRKRRKTFSLLPVQLIPYFQYTLSAVIGTLLLALKYRQMGQQGFYGASIDVDPESLITPWLIACWMRMVLRGLRRGHRSLVRFYDLNEIRTPKHSPPPGEMAGYFKAFGLRPQAPWTHLQELLQRLVYRYSHATAQFLFGIPSQSRLFRNLPARSCVAHA